MSSSAQGEPDEILVDFWCTPWIISSQRSADLYHSGVKLWRKEDLVDIEQQLAQSRTLEKLRVRRIDGSFIQIKNPNFGVQNPIWRPFVKFQEYWALIGRRPDGAISTRPCTCQGRIRAKPTVPTEFYTCTYLVEWVNQTSRTYEGPVENSQALFQDHQQHWNASATCQAFTSKLFKLLGGDGNPRKVTKIICFGLGDLHYKPLSLWRTEEKSKLDDQGQPITSIVHRSLIQHSLALTIAGVARSCAMGSNIRLLTQDPIYSHPTYDLLQETGFEITGRHGAGGFAELDDLSIVFSPFISAPLSQIIAELARPVVIICNRPKIIDLEPGKLCADPESPRTREMWKEYETYELQVSPDDSKAYRDSLDGLMVHIRVRE